MTPLVRDHVIVELLDILTVLAQQEQGIDVAAVKRRAQLADIDIALGQIVVNAPERIERCEIHGWIRGHDQSHGRINRIEDRKRRGGSGAGKTTARPAVRGAQVPCFVGAAGAAGRAVEDIQRTLCQKHPGV